MHRRWFVALIVVAAAVHPDLASADVGDGYIANGTCAAETARYTFNATVRTVATDSGYQVKNLDWVYHDRDNALANEASNNVIIKIKWRNAQDDIQTYYQWSSPDTQDYGEPYSHIPAVSVTVPYLRKGHVSFSVAFDKPNKPDPHCTANVYLDDSNEDLGPLCDIDPGNRRGPVLPVC